MLASGIDMATDVTLQYEQGATLKREWAFIFNREHPLDHDRLQDRMNQAPAPDYRPIANRANRYQQDRRAMDAEVYSGIPMRLFQVQDLCVWERAGPIQDRTQEHLVPSDIAIVASRKLLLGAIRAVQERQDPPHVVRDPERAASPRIVAGLDHEIPTTLDCLVLVSFGRAGGPGIVQVPAEAFYADRLHSKVITTAAKVWSGPKP